LIACANLVNLVLVRVASRGRELAVRAALGASRMSLALPFVSEAMILAAAGSALGVLVANLGLTALLALDPGNLPRASEVRLSGPVLGFALAVTAATAIVLALAAAWRALRPEIADSLRSASRGQAGGAAVSRVRSVLIVTQLASSIVLLIAAGLLARSMNALLSQDPGFNTERVLAIDLSSTATENTPAAMASLAGFHERYLEKLRALPGVEHSGGISRFPLGSGYANGGFIKVRGGEDWSQGFDLFRRLAQDPSRTGSAEFRVASAGYFPTMGIPLKRGRLFQPGDVAGAPHVAVISETLARTSWPGEDPIGKSVQFGNMDGDLRTFTIVGIVGDIRERGLDAAPRPTLYADFRQRPRHTYSFTAVVQGNVDAGSLTGAARAALRDMNPEMAPRIRAIDEIFTASVADRRFTLIVVGAFAGAALLLAVLGIYGVLSYVVSQRTREFGVRMALGAQRSDVWRMVLRQAFTLVALGSAIGVAAAYLATRAMRSLLFEVTPADPMTFAGVVGTLAVAAFIACQVPARRATKVSPLDALRAE
ncbi:MAG: FtsX-like permease family protein, partial [Acidobacteriota bacterium]|nr:FtsX-like permease family protein [Acidobacteriota bacterium]